MSVVVIVDYGSGNLHSAAKAFERANRETTAGCEIRVSALPQDVRQADRIVLPGVGAFADCMGGLAGIAGMRDAIERAVLADRKPFLGICVGMQLLAARGLEFAAAGDHGTPGLGWIGGEVRRIAPADPALKIPHMGWNTLHEVRSHPLMAGIETGEAGLHAYFVHSFHLADPPDGTVVATTDHGGPVTAMVARDNIAGTQFHPEKSQALGLRLIGNFLAWNGRDVVATDASRTVPA